MYLQVENSPSILYQETLKELSQLREEYDKVCLRIEVKAFP